MPDPKPNLMEIPMGDYAHLIDSYYESGLIYRLSLDQLGRSFLTDYFDLGHGENFNKIKRLYIENTGVDPAELAEDEETFFTKIAELFFSYDRAPGNILVVNFQQASAHLNEIDTRIAEIEAEINKIKAGGNSTAIQTDVPVLSYFLLHNKSARDQIIAYLKKDIYSYTLRSADPLSRSAMSFSVPYNYAWNPQAFVVAYPTMISNKFGRLPLKSYKKVEKMFAEDKAAFQQFLEEYIDHEEVIHFIRMDCNENHFLYPRMEIILEALTAYEEKKRILFSSISMTIIEGIFHDVCIALGYEENALLGAGFQEKVNYLQKHLTYEFNYEYYSFKFRLLRNKIAHGLMEPAEAQEIADLILLDLKDAIEISHSMKIPVNQKRFFLDQALKEGTTGDFRYLAAYLLMKTTNIPAFYNIPAEEENALALLQSAEFFSYLDKCLEGEGHEKILCFTLVRALKDNEKITDEAIKKECGDRLKKSYTKGLPKFSFQEFIAPLVGYVPANNQN